MQLQLQSFAGLVGTAAAAVQGSARQLIDLTVGSTLRAVLEASASVGLWVQWLTLQVLQTTRASTSEAADLDSWMADFTVARLPAVAASGQVTFGRFVGTGMAVVPAGTVVRTADGTQSFVVVGSAGEPGFNASLGGYPLESGALAITVPVEAQIAGTAGNVQAGAVTLIAATLPGVDMVGNAAALAGGQDGESDDALRARFTLFMTSLARATPAAIGYAIAGVQQGLQHTLVENVLPDGSSRVGCFVVTVDDGSGTPSASLLAAVSGAIETMRPVGASYTVRAPAVVYVDVSLTVAVMPGIVAGPVKDGVALAVRAFIDSLPLGAPLAWSRLVQVAYAAAPEIVNVTAVSINGGAADIVVDSGTVVKAGIVAVN